MVHHQRRRSGHLSAHTSTTDVRKTVGVSDMSKQKRPGMSRRQTPVSSQKLGKSQRERERDQQLMWDDERESFPQYCMTCEKQFLPYDDKHLYCSDHCRKVDQRSSQSTDPQMYSFGSTFPTPQYNDTEPRDIIPPASPSRPTSLYMENSPPTSPGFSPYEPSSAISALRTLNSLSARPPSPPSPTDYYSGGFWPFSRSNANSPNASYARPSGGYLSSTYNYDSHASSRQPSGNARPRSVQLMTPMVGGR